MAISIEPLGKKQGSTFEQYYPQTHTDAVICADGSTLTQKLKDIPETASTVSIKRIGVKEYADITSLL